MAEAQAACAARLPPFATGRDIRYFGLQHFSVFVRP